MIKKHWKLLATLMVLIGLLGAGYYGYTSGFIEKWTSEQTIPFQYFGSPAISQQVTKETAVDTSTSYVGHDQTSITSLQNILNQKTIYIDSYKKLFADSSYSILTKAYEKIEQTPYSFPQSSGIAYVGWLGDKKNVILAIPWFSDENIVKNNLISLKINRAGQFYGAKYLTDDRESYNLPIIKSVKSVNPEYQVTLAKALLSTKLNYIKQGGSWTKIVQSIPTELQTTKPSNIGAYNMIGATFSSVNTGIVRVVIPNNTGTSVSDYLFNVNLNTQSITGVTKMKENLK